MYKEVIDLLTSIPLMIWVQESIRFALLIGVLKCLKTLVQAVDNHFFNSIWGR